MIEYIIFEMHKLLHTYVSWNIQGHSKVTARLYVGVCVCVCVAAGVDLNLIIHGKQ